MNGWTPQMVFSLPREWHRDLVAMLQDDDQAGQAPTGFSSATGFNDS